jgi:NADPH:quinone reductase-like Zn-dependent oxidoreductase
MKAAQIVDYGDKDVLQIHDIDRPSAGEGQVLVAVYAASLNPFDWKVRSGAMREFMKLELPATLGGDFSGVITEIGPGVTGWQVGQEVYGQATATGGQGSWAEYAPIKVENFSRKPENLSFAEAAAAPLVSVSAYQALVESLKLQPGQKILIHGGAGGIGSMAIQLAKHLGAEVATTVSEHDMEFVRGLGADTIVDYKNENFSDILKDYDAVFDTVGGETYQKSFNVLKSGGAILSMVELPDEALAKQHGVDAYSQQTRTTPDRLDAVRELLESGALKVYIDKTFPLDEAAEALEYLHTGSPKGKLVLTIAAS